MRRSGQRLASVTIALLCIGVAATRWQHGRPDPGHSGAWLAQLATAVVFGAFGLIVTQRVAGASARVGVLLQVAALTQALALAAGAWARHGGLPGSTAADWLDNWAWAPGVLACLTVLPYLFPTGTPLPRWRTATAVATASVGLFCVAEAIDTAPSVSAKPFVQLATILVVVTTIGGLVSLVHRYVSSGAATRAQIRWVAFAVALVMISQPVQAALPADAGHALLAAVPLILPIAIGIAIRRYRLYDIDLLVSRSISYAVLTAVLTGIYLGVSVAVGEGAGSRTAGNHPGTTVVAAAVVALVAMPLRRLLQGQLDVRLLGDRTPAAVLTRLTGRLRDTVAAHELPHAVVRSVREAFRCPWAALELTRLDGRVVVRVDDGTPCAGVDVPVTYRGQALGVLTVGWRATDEPYDDAEMRLIEGLVAAAAPAIDGLLLTEDLRESREAIGAARDRERQRLHRDLHDGLGPTLAGITLGLDAAANYVETDPARAKTTIGRLRALAISATSDVRGIIEGLRPPVLDSMGLLGALQRHAELAVPDLEIVIEADELGALPAAVEVAALHIALEALTNVHRHARARRCWVRLHRTCDGITLAIEDDGVGVRAGVPTQPAARGGVGLASIEQRAREIGGDVTMGDGTHGGFAVHVRLPITVGAA